MAAIDKIYGTKEQHDEFRVWAEQNKLNILNYFYSWEWHDERHDEKEHPITNFPTDVDEWLLENCPLEWVTARIRDQYSITDDQYSLT